MKKRISTVTAVAAIYLALGAATGAMIGISAADAAAISGIAQVDDINVDYGTPLSDVIARLPATTTITLDNGQHETVNLHWNVSEYVQTGRGENIVRQPYEPEVRGAYEFTATFGLPEGVTHRDPSLRLQLRARVSVGAAGLLDINDRSVFDQPGRYVSESMRFGDTERTYQYYVPSSYQSGDPVPVMFSFHGAGSYGLGQMVYSDFHRVAEREGFILVTPDYGVNARGTFQTPGVADFTSAILDRMIENYHVDESRVYASGISMGGNASITLANELSDRIAAVAPVASGIASALDMEFPRPMTVVWFYGNQDTGYGPRLYDTLAHLNTRMGTDRRPLVNNWQATEDDPTRITRFHYDGGENGAEVIFYRIEEGGHTWPGKYQYASLITVGLTSQHIDATEHIWEHLKNHRLP